MWTLQPRQALPYVQQAVSSSAHLHTCPQHRYRTRTRRKVRRVLGQWTQLDKDCEAPHMSDDCNCKGLREELLKFACWCLEGESGEGHEEEIVDRYIREERS